ncbi:superoxide dismutase [Cu-Zn] SodC [Azotobacter beijerinckii]|uniref:superoxide dismutase [Cu-Zn] SodC n=1 Tax=Azotobacter beijerinckii TaxID=170623 RepID=UPI0029553BD4|nr:superoxide dismutase [Cu-Zn] SodC [Azotobacter beijerinckii]MDV7210591.1 superoxide dismutase [Cu-Zn] SodC [Azotobacter beijerinckii]
MKKWLIAAVTASGAMTLQAAPLSVTLNAVSADGTGTALGTISIEQSEYGLVFTPDLSGLQPGTHGFHVHASGSCAVAEKDGQKVPAGAAGGHWDPQNTAKHGQPWGDGHLGDLPALYVGTDGKATQPVLAPRLKDLEALKGHALMVHAGGDNHADSPAPLGGGGARVACGVIK